MSCTHDASLNESLKNCSSSFETVDEAISKIPPLTKRGRSVIRLVERVENFICHTLRAAIRTKFFIYRQSLVKGEKVPPPEGENIAKMEC